MELRRELLLTIGALVGLNLLLAFGAIGLLTRMGPAIEHILEENVYSIVAAEELLGEFAAAEGRPLGPDGVERVHAALERAKRNVTEDEEWPVLASIEEALPGAAAARPGSRQQLVDDVRQLIRINREAVHRVDEEAKRLGTAGAWAAAFAGFLSFLSSVVVAARLQRRFARPLADLHEVLESARRGDRHRRCRSTHAPVELVQVAEAVNRLLDERVRDTSPVEEDGVRP